MEDERDQRIRERAYRLWLEEGRPEGRAEAHWEMASEMAALEDKPEGMTIPNPLKPGQETLEQTETVEAIEAVENAGEFPTLTDQGEETVAPKRRTRPRKAKTT